MNKYYRYYVVEVARCGYSYGYFSDEWTALGIRRYLEKVHPDRVYRVGRITMRDCIEVRDRLEKKIVFTVRYSDNRYEHCEMRRYATEAEATYYMRRWEKQFIKLGAEIVDDGVIC